MSTQSAMVLSAVLKALLYIFYSSHLILYINSIVWVELQFASVESCLPALCYGPKSWFITFVMLLTQFLLLKLCFLTACLVLTVSIKAFYISYVVLLLTVSICGVMWYQSLSCPTWFPGGMPLLSNLLCFCDETITVVFVLIFVENRHQCWL